MLEWVKAPFDAIRNYIWGDPYHTFKEIKAAQNFFESLEAEALGRGNSMGLSPYQSQDLGQKRLKIKLWQGETLSAQEQKELVYLEEMLLAFDTRTQLIEQPEEIPDHTELLKLAEEYSGYEKTVKDRGESYKKTIKAALKKVCANYPHQANFLIKRGKAAQAEEQKLRQALNTASTKEKSEKATAELKCFLHDKDKNYFGQFLSFCIRYDQSFEVFFSYVKEREALTKSLVPQYFKGANFHHGEGIRIMEDQYKHRHLTIAIDTAAGTNETETLVQDADQLRYVSVLNKTYRIALNHFFPKPKDQVKEYQPTIGEIYAQLEKHKATYGNLHIFERGIALWNPIESGELYYKHEVFTGWRYIFSLFFNLTKRLVPVYNKAPAGLGSDASAWFNSLPKTRPFSKDDLKQHFPDQHSLVDDLRDDQAAFATMISRERPEAHPDIDGNHAYVVIIVPCEDDKFHLYPIGFQPKEMPTTTPQLLLATAATKEGFQHYPDASFSFFAREHMGFFFPFDINDLSDLQKILFHHFKQSEEGRKPFQAQGTNCTYFVQKMFTEFFINRRIFDVMAKIGNPSLAAENQWKKDVMRAMKSYDNEHLKKLLSDKIDKATSIGELIDHVKNLEELLDFTLFQPALRKQPEKPWRLAVPEGEIFNEKDVLAQFKREFDNLLITSLESMQFYRTTIKEVTSKNPPINTLLTWLQAPTRWQRLKLAFFYLLLWVIGSNKGYYVKKTYPSGKVRWKKLSVQNALNFQNGKLSTPSTLATTLKPESEELSKRRNAIQTAFLEIDKIVKATNSEEWMDRSIMSSTAISHKHLSSSYTQVSLDDSDVD